MLTEDPVRPSPDAVREQLERVLGSEAFSTAGRHSRLLRYLVDRTLAGEGDRLKEYVLGTEVFDRADSYDPRLDSIVRVEVRRLRSRLEEYYRGPGASDPVMLAIPRGSYVPEFAFASRAPIGTTPADGVPPTPVEHRTTNARMWGVAGALLVLVTLFTIRLAFDRPPAAQAAASPAIAVLPFESYSTDERDVLIAARITDAVTAELAQLGTVSVASRTSAWQYAGKRRPAMDIANALRVDMLLEASAVPVDGGVRVIVRLVDATLDRKVWVGEYESPPADFARLTSRIAEDTASAALAYHSR